MRRDDLDAGRLNRSGPLRASWPGGVRAERAVPSGCRWRRCSVDHAATKSSGGVRRWSVLCLLAVAKYAWIAGPPSTLPCSSFIVTLFCVHVSFRRSCSCSCFIPLLQFGWPRFPLPCFSQFSPPVVITLAGLLAFVLPSACQLYYYLAHSCFVSQILCFPPLRPVFMIVSHSQPIRFAHRDAQTRRSRG